MIFFFISVPYHHFQLRGLRSPSHVLQRRPIYFHQFFFYITGVSELLSQDLCEKQCKILLKNQDKLLEEEPPFCFTLFHRREGAPLYHEKFIRIELQYIVLRICVVQYIEVIIISKRCLFIIFTSFMCKDYLSKVRL